MLTRLGHLLPPLICGLGGLLFVTGRVGGEDRQTEKPESEQRLPAWVEPMRRVHARFKGQPKTLAHFGDSITVTMAYWAPLEHLGKDVPKEMQRPLATVQDYMAPQCWRTWKGPEYGSDGGQTIRWAHENIGGWLDKLRPEAAVIMFGTNDLGGIELEEYDAKTRQVVSACLERGTVPILSTIPPRHGFDEKAAVFAAAVRAIADDMHVPLIDYQAEVLARRPDDWDGQLEKFNRYEGYEVPTLIARDGVHPSYPEKHQHDFSEESLRSSGYTLRSYLTLLKYAEVINLALKPNGD